MPRRIVSPINSPSSNDSVESGKFITKERAAKYDALMPLLQAMFGEFKDLSKRKPDAALNARKVEIVNRLLKDVLTIIEDEPNRQYLDLLDDDDMPQNSDILLMLSQFVAAMQAFHERYWIREGHLSRWRTK